MTGEGLAHQRRRDPLASRLLTTVPRPASDSDPGLADRVSEALERAGVPAPWRSRSFASFIPRAGTEEALNAARAVVDQPPRMDGRGERAPSLVLCSATKGTGKTHLAIAILHELAQGGRLYQVPIGDVDELLAAGKIAAPRLAGRFVHVAGLLRALRATIGRPELSDPLEPLFTIPLLVLDDLGAEKSSEWVIEQLTLLVEERYMANRTMVVTTNSATSRMGARYRAITRKHPQESGGNTPAIAP